MINSDVRPSAEHRTLPHSQEKPFCITANLAVNVAVGSAADVEGASAECRL